MRKKIQLGMAVLAAMGFLALAGNVCAQKVHEDRPPQSHPAQSHPAQAHPQNQGNNNPNRPPANANRAPANAYRPPANPNRNGQAQSHPNAYNENRPRNGGEAGYARREQPGANGQRSWINTMRDLTPDQRNRVLQNSRAFQNLPPDKQNRIRQMFNQWDHMTPQQRQDLRSREQIWNHLTPEQQQHIKNDVMPKWNQMSPDRQQVMGQKLSVLQNMPESARNERLNDPNFTRGMSDDEKSMLRDLAHTHVGGPPDPPGE